MPEDDFDIYGEDEGFTTKGQVVRRIRVFVAVSRMLITVLYVLKSLEDYDENANTDLVDDAATSPAVGDKRQREDDEHDEQQNKQPPPAPVDVKLEPESRIQTSMTRSPSSSGGHLAANGNAGVGAPMGNTSGANQGFDALYIGDLQWVRLVRASMPYVVADTRIRAHIFSGRQTKICVRLQENWVSISTIRTSHSRSTKSMGRAKGALLVGCMYARFGVITYPLV